MFPWRKYADRGPERTLSRFNVRDLRASALLYDLVSLAHILPIPSKNPQHRDGAVETPGRAGAAIKSSPLMLSASSDVEDGRSERSPSGRSQRPGGLPPQLELTGFKILQRLEFWQLFSVLALLAGIGLMTIK